MSTSDTSPERLADMPLWRLLVLLADVEREIGASSSTARVIARLVNEKLRGAPQKPATVKRTEVVCA